MTSVELSTTTLSPQTLADLTKIEDILGQRLHELSIEGATEEAAVISSILKTTAVLVSSATAP